NRRERGRAHRAARFSHAELRTSHFSRHARRARRIRRVRRSHLLKYHVSVFQRRTTGSVVCPSCGSLVGVRDDKCYSCGRSNPGLWGYGPLVRKIGADFGFVPVVVGGSTIIYALTLLVSGSRLQIAGGGFYFLSPSFQALMLFGMSGT